MLAALVVGVASCGRSGEGPLDLAFEEADSTVSAAVDAELVPGAVLLVARGGRVLHERAFGYARLYDFGARLLDQPERMTTGHVFDLASVTKVLATTFGVMLLVDRGRVDLDAPVARYLSEFSGPHKDSVTVRHLLSHTGGLAQWRPVYYHARTPDEARRFVTAAPLRFAVGKARRYSDLGFMLLGYLVEEVSGQPLDEFLTSEVYRPLGLRSTAFRPRDAGLGPFAATSHGNPFEKRMVEDDDFGYFCPENPDSFTAWRQYTLLGEVNDGNAYYAHGGVAGHAGLFSTARDMVILVDLLLSGHSRIGRDLISRETIDGFLSSGPFGNGLGWAMSEQVLGLGSAPPGTFGHTGFTGTYVLGLPKYDVGVILLTNRQNLGVGPDTRYNDVNPLRREVARIVIEALESGEVG